MTFGVKSYVDSCGFASTMVIEYLVQLYYGVWALWQSPKGKRWLTHWASVLRWRYNLTTRDSPKRTLKGGPYVRERQGSWPAKQKPKHNPCRPVGRNWKVPILIDRMIPVSGNHRHLDTRYLAKVHMIVWNPKGIPTWSMENMKWYSPSQVLTAKHVSYPQLTATGLHQVVVSTGNHFPMHAKIWKHHQLPKPQPGQLSNTDPRQME